MSLGGDGGSIPRPADRYHDLLTLARHLAALRRRYRHVIDADLSDAIDDAALLIALAAEGVRHG